MKFLRENGMGIKQIIKEVVVGVGTVFFVNFTGEIYE